MKDLKISVVIPTYNSMLYLKETLDSFKHQTIDKDSFEIIVVDDGSRDGTKYLVDEFREDFDISYYYMEDKGFRLAAARNIGIHFAKHPIALMFDCGMLASRDLLKAHIDVHEEMNNVVVIGMSYGVEEFSMINAQAIKKILDENPLDKSFSLLKESGTYDDCRYKAMEEIGFDLSKIKSPWVVCWGGHISCKTQTLREVNGFDEWFNTWGGEDVELAIRLHNKGCFFHILRSMEAIHIPHFRNEDENIKSSKKNIKYIVSKHSDRRVKLLEDFGWKHIFHAA